MPTTVPWPLMAVEEILAGIIAVQASGIWPLAAVRLDGVSTAAIESATDQIHSAMLTVDHWITCSSVSAGGVIRLRLSRLAVG